MRIVALVLACGLASLSDQNTGATRKGVLNGQDESTGFHRQRSDRRGGRHGCGRARGRPGETCQEGPLPERRQAGETPLFNGTVSYGNLLFIAGVGYHSEGDIKVHTKNVLDQIQQTLERVGSSMEKVLKCNVYLNDLKDYAGMNEMFLGRFGSEPPVRTTIAAAGGIPGNSLVEIDVIAYI